MPRINLLPWREQQRTERKKSFAVGMFVALFVAGLITLGGYMFMRSLVDAQTERNNRLAREITELDKAIQQINDLEQRKQQFIARMQIIEKLTRSRPEIVHVFDTIAETVPDGIYLTSIVQNGQKIKIQGVTQSATRVATFMRQLDGSEWFRDSFPVLPNETSFSLDTVQVTKINDPASGAK